MRKISESSSSPRWKGGGRPNGRMQSDGSPRHPSDRTVLLAEENPAERDEITRLLSGRFRVVCAGDCDSAVTLAERERPDLVLSGNLDGLKGEELVRALRERPSLRQTPVIRLARSHEGLSFGAEKPGANDYLMRPFTAGELFARIQTQLELLATRETAAERERRLRIELEQQVRDLQALHETTLRVAGFRDVNDALNEILASALKAAGTSRGLLSLCNADGTSLRIGASRGFSDEFLAQVREVRAGCGACGRALQRRERVIVRDARTEPAFECLRDAVDGAGFAACHSVPLITRSDEMIGVLSAHFDRPHTPDEREIRLLDLYAQMAADLIERTRWIEELRAGNEEKQRILANLTHGFFTLDRDLRLRHVNDAGLRIIGMPVERAIGRPLHDLFPDDTCARLEAACREALVRTSAQRVEIFSQAGNRWLEHRVSSWPGGLTVMVADITERKRAEEALRLTGERFRLAAGSEALTLYEQDLDLRYTWLYPLHPEHSGGLGHTDRELLPEDEARFLEQTKREVIRTAKERRCEVRTTLPTGVAWYDVFISPRRNEAGEVVGVAGAALDITERKRAELQREALYELVATVNQAASLEAVYEAALNAIMRCQNADRASILLYDDQGVMRFVADRGLSPAYKAAVEGHSPWRRDDPAPEPVCIEEVAIAPIDEHLREVVLRERIRALAFIPITYEQRLLGKFMVYYREPHRFEPDELHTAVTMASQVAFAIERKRSGEALERLVRDRTVSLREAVQQMEEFSYTVSHDLRAPLRGMNAYSKALIEDFSGALPAEALSYARKIQQNAERLDRMILDVLTFSRVAREDVRLAPVDLGRLVQDIIAQYPAMQPPAAQVTIGKLEPVMGHEPSLVQVLSNLLNNAVKFVRPGTKPAVEIWTERADDSITLSIRDDGVGIDPRYQHRLFNMFERLHAECGYEGTGVGLAIVRKAVERMGGACGVESDGVNGARFWIRLKSAMPGGSEPPSGAA